MKPHQLDKSKSYFLSTPYTRFPAGIEAAYEQACEIAGALILSGLHVYSPIAHSHGIALAAKLNPLNADFWMRADVRQRANADAMIVAMLPTWRTSKGVSHEIAEFRAARKPVYYLDPGSMTVSVEIRAEVA